MRARRTLGRTAAHAHSSMRRRVSARRDRRAVTRSVRLKRAQLFTAVRTRDARVDPSHARAAAPSRCCLEAPPPSSSRVRRGRVRRDT
jgi:hypothetical protein